MKKIFAVGYAKLEQLMLVTNQTQVAQHRMVESFLKSYQVTPYSTKYFGQLLT